MRRPDLADLERGIHEFQASESASADDPASRYEQRIVRNLEDVVRREHEQGESLRAAGRARLALLLGHEGSSEQLEAELCRSIAAGGLDESSLALMQHLRADVMARLEIDNPRYWSLEAAKSAARAGATACE